MAALTGLTDLLCSKTGDPAAFAAAPPRMIPATVAEALHDARRHWEHDAAAERGHHPAKAKVAGEAAVPRLGGALTARLRELELQQVQETFKDGSPADEPPSPTGDGARGSVGPRGSMAPSAVKKGSAVHTLLTERVGQSASPKHCHNAVLPPNIMRIIDHHRRVGIERHEAYVNETLTHAAVASESTAHATKRRSHGVSNISIHSNGANSPPDSGQLSPATPEVRGRRSRRTHNKRLTASRCIAGVAEHMVHGAPKKLQTDAHHVHGVPSVSQAADHMMQLFSSSASRQHGMSVRTSMDSEAASNSESPRPPSEGGVQEFADSAHKADAADVALRKQQKEHRRVGFQQQNERRRVGFHETPDIPDGSERSIRSQEGIATRPSTPYSDGRPTNMLQIQPRQSRSRPGSRSPSPGASSKPAESSGLAKLRATLQSKQSDHMEANAKAKRDGAAKLVAAAGKEQKKARRNITHLELPEDDELQVPPTPLTPTPTGGKRSEADKLRLGPGTPKSDMSNVQQQMPGSKGANMLFQRGGVKMVVAERSLVKGQKRSKSAGASPSSPPVPGTPFPVTGLESYFPGQSRPEVRADELEEVPIKVVGWSSQLDDGRHAACNLADAELGSMWESKGPPEQHVVFDTEQNVEVCGIILRCMGTKTDPKDVTLMRSSNKDGPWTIVRRVFVNAGPKNRERLEHEFLFQVVGESRYWKLDINQNWGAPGQVQVHAPIKFLFRQKKEDAEIDDVPGEAYIPARRSICFSSLFEAAETLSVDDCEVRRLARIHEIPLHFADNVHDEFQKFSSGQRRLRYDDFSRLLHAMVARSTVGSAVKRFDHLADLPESRVRNLWNEVDSDKGGYVEYEEFVIWFYRMFHCDATSGRSVHSSNKQASTVTERFYAGLGRERLRKMVQKMDDAADRHERKLERATGNNQ